MKKMNLPNNFIHLGKDGVARNLISVIRVGDFDGLPSEGVGFIASSFADDEPRDFGKHVCYKDAENSIPLYGLWFHDKRSIQGQIKMLELCLELFKEEKEE